LDGAIWPACASIDWTLIITFATRLPSCLPRRREQSPRVAARTAICPKAAGALR